MDFLQILGYTGSVIIGISLVMKNITYLRRLNLIGAATFALYGLFIGAYPVFVLNSFIALVDFYYLFEMYRQKDYFSLLPISSTNHYYLNRFLEFHKDDIKKFFPEFSGNQINEKSNILFILRNMLPVGVFIYEEMAEGKINLLIDYAIPDYRDMKNGKFVYKTESSYLLEKGFKEIITESSVKAHQGYLLKLGFEPVEGKPNQYKKLL